MGCQLHAPVNPKGHPIHIPRPARLLRQQTQAGHRRPARHAQKQGDDSPNLRPKQGSKTVIFLSAHNHGGYIRAFRTANKKAHYLIDSRLSMCDNALSGVADGEQALAPYIHINQ